MIRMIDRLCHAIRLATQPVVDHWPMLVSLILTLAAAGFLLGYVGFHQLAFWTALGIAELIRMENWRDRGE